MAKIAHEYIDLGNNPVNLESGVVYVQIMTYIKVDRTFEEIVTHTHVVRDLSVPLTEAANVSMDELQDNESRKPMGFRPPKGAG